MNSASSLEGLTRFDGPKPGPVVALIGSMHGNEPCGAYAVNKLHQELRLDTLNLERGSLVLVIGNPRAIEEGSRFTHGGVDLNRVFDFEFLNTVPESEWAYEHRRAAEMRPYLEEWDAVLDLHSTSFPTEPFGIWPHGSPPSGLGEQLQLRTLTRGWERMGLPGAQALVLVLPALDHQSLLATLSHHSDQR
ncbi:MAG: succinylglutamate desuccinylase/aspartoacylase family protein, partial [Myxococcota bacterium]